MKNNKRNIYSALVSSALALSLPVVAFAADIDEKKAVDIALADADYKVSDVIYSHAEYDFDDGREKWDVEFLVKDNEGLYREYSYEISVSDGHILEKEWEVEDDYRPSDEKADVKQKDNKKADKKDNKADEKASKDVADVKAEDIGKDKAKELALRAFGLDEKDVKILKLKKDHDDGAEVYEVKFRQGFKAKYSCDVLSHSGQVIDKDVEYVEGFFNKVEFGFELFEDWLEGLFD